MAITPSQTFDIPSPDDHFGAFVEYLERQIDSRLLYAHVKVFSDSDRCTYVRMSVDCPNNCLSFIDEARTHIETTYRAAGWGGVEVTTMNVETSEVYGWEFKMGFLLTR